MTSTSSQTPRVAGTGTGTCDVLVDYERMGELGNEAAQAAATKLDIANASSSQALKSDAILSSKKTVKKEKKSKKEKKKKKVSRNN